MAGTVVVGCKLPNGIVLHLDKCVGDEKGGNVNRVAHPLGPVKLLGTAKSRVPQTVKGYRPAGPGGFALTRNVSKDFMDEWIKENANTPLVKNGFVFLCATLDKATDQAEQTGADQSEAFGPLDPNKLPTNIQALDKTESGEGAEAA